LKDKTDLIYLFVAALRTVHGPSPLAELDSLHNGGHLIFAQNGKLTLSLQTIGKQSPAFHF